MGEKDMAEEMAERRKIATQSVRFCLTVMSIGCSLCVILGCFWNHMDWKYTRSQLASRSCRQELFIMTVPNSQFCCSDKEHRKDWVCTASYGMSNRIFTSLWGAVVIPLLPLSATAITELVTRDADTRNGKDVVKAFFLRLTLYVTIILYRMYVLYLGGDYVQTKIQEFKIFTKADHQSCWYSSLMRDERCKDYFDYSDHIVLFMVQYATIACLEIAYTISQRQNTSVLSRHFVTFSLAFILVTSSMYSILLTCMFFHTAAECFTALAIVLAMVAAPLYIYADLPAVIDFMCPRMVRV